VYLLVVAAQRAFAFKRSDYDPLEFVAWGSRHSSCRGRHSRCVRDRVRAIALGYRGPLRMRAAVAGRWWTVVLLFMLNAHVVGAIRAAAGAGIAPLARVSTGR
jgi:hypothetical protein